MYDTVYVSPQGLVGAWKMYKIETVTNGTVTSSSNTLYIFNFTSSQLQEDMNGDNVYEYIYPVTYGSNYVDVFYTSTPDTYVITAVGAELRLTRQSTPTQSQVWFLKK